MYRCKFCTKYVEVKKRQNNSSINSWWTLSFVALRTRQRRHFGSPSVRLPHKTTTHCHHTYIRSDLVEVSLLTFTYISTRHAVLSVWVHARPLSWTWTNFQPVITTARWLVRGGGGGPISAQLTILHVVYKLVCSSEETRQTVLQAGRSHVEYL